MTDEITTKKIRIYEFDILRVLAILFILLYHTQNVAKIEYFDHSIFGNFGIWGLVVFFFLFGFFLYKYPCNDFYLFKSFLKSKFIRIIPLYWFTLIFNYIIFIILGWDISYPDVSVPQSKVKIIFQIFTLQSLTGIQTFYAMWFVGALVLFILLYGIIAYLTKDKFILIISLLLLYIPLNILTTQDILRPSILFYYPVFISGIFAGFFYLNSNEINPVLKRLPDWVKYCSYSSYAVYLFHFSVYVVLNVVLTYFGLSNDIFVIILGIPLSFVIGYFAQKGYDNSVGKWLNDYLSREAYN